MFDLALIKSATDCALNRNSIDAFKSQVGNYEYCKHLMESCLDGTVKELDEMSPISILDFRIINSNLLDRCGFYVSNQQVYLVAITTVGDYNWMATYPLNFREFATLSIRSKENSSFDQLVELLPKEVSPRRLSRSPILLHERSFIDLYSFVRTKLEDLPDSIHDGFIQMTSQNIGYLNSLEGS
jgi:hypothetical protein